MRDAPAGGVVSIPPGTRLTTLLIEAPVSLIAMGEVVLAGLRSAAMSLRIEGEVDRPQRFDFAALSHLPQLDVSTRVPGKVGQGVPLSALLSAAGSRPGARFLTLVAADGRFAVSVPLADVADNALVAYALGGEPLPASQGGPARFYVIDAAACASGQVDACANVKRLGVLRLTLEREPDVGHEHPPRK